MAKVLIIGAASAIAREVARLCARRGDRLYLLARSERALVELRRELGDCVVGHAFGDFNDFELNPGRVANALVALDGATCPRISNTRCICGECPWMPSKPKRLSN